MIPSDSHAGSSVPRERDDEEPRQVAAQRLLKALEGRRAGRTGLSESGTVLEQQRVAPLARRKRGIVHGPSDIGGGAVARIPRTELKPPSGRADSEGGFVQVVTWW